MTQVDDVVDGWEVRFRADGGFGVYDSHGLLSGPFGRRDEAIAAARKLPKPRDVLSVWPKEQLARPRVSSPKF